MWLYAIQAHFKFNLLNQLIHFFHDSSSVCLLYDSMCVYLSASQCHSKDYTHILKVVNKVYKLLLLFCYAKRTICKRKLTGIIPFSRLGVFCANLGSPEIFFCHPKKGVLKTNGK